MIDDTEFAIERHRCEVRHILRARVDMGRGAVDSYLEAVAAKRGKDAAQALREECARQWAAGNRGAKGDWR